MKISALFVLALLAATGNSLYAAPPAPPTVAVYDFTAAGESANDMGAPHDVGPSVTALVTADLATESNLVLVERQELSKALNEQAFGISGMVSSVAAAKIGEITGAKILVAGQVIKTGQDGHLVIIAYIIGTETGRLFAAQVEGGPDNLEQLSSDLSDKIAHTISTQATNLLAPAQESHDERVERIVKSVKGKNRPAVSVTIFWPNYKGHCSFDEGEFGAILLKAGFTVVDDKSDRKPDIEITGVDQGSAGPRRGDLFSFNTVIDLKIQERRTGNILDFDHQEATATEASMANAGRSAQVNAVDALAERVLPLLAQ